MRLESMWRFLNIYPFWQTREIADFSANFNTFLAQNRAYRIGPICLVYPR